jgi:8-oxo-dGTP pyrophosphatase MutT (NUDIX family)
MKRNVRRFCRIVKKTFYSGAGILVSSRDVDNEIHVLLGKRKYNPHKGKWSIPGGRKNREEADFKTAALREMSEEIVLDGMHQPRHEELTPVFTFLSGVFNWRTYHLHVDNPALPHAGCGRDKEFDQLQWFPVDQLPAPLHWGVRNAVRKAVKKAQ